MRDLHHGGTLSPARGWAGRKFMSIAHVRNSRVIARRPCTCKRVARTEHRRFLPLGPFVLGRTRSGRSSNVCPAGPTTPDLKTSSPSKSIFPKPANPNQLGWPTLDVSADLPGLSPRRSASEWTAWNVHGSVAFFTWLIRLFGWPYCEPQKAAKLPADQAMTP